MVLQNAASDFASVRRAPYQDGRSESSPSRSLLQSRAMEVRSSALGDEHPSTLIAMVNLDSTYRKQRRPRDAEELLARVKHLSSNSRTVSLYVDSADEHGEIPVFRRVPTYLFRIEPRLICFLKLSLIPVCQCELSSSVS
jgi:hypothetical protein